MFVCICENMIHNHTHNINSSYGDRRKTNKKRKRKKQEKRIHTCSFCKKACPKKIASSEATGAGPPALLSSCTLGATRELVDMLCSADRPPPRFLQVFLMRSRDGNFAILWLAYLLHNASCTLQKCSYFLHTSHLQGKARWFFHEERRKAGGIGEKSST